MGRRLGKLEAQIGCEDDYPTLLWDPLIKTEEELELLIQKKLESLGKVRGGLFVMPRPIEDPDEWEQHAKEVMARIEKEREEELLVAVSEPADLRLGGTRA